MFELVNSTQDHNGFENYENVNNRTKHHCHAENKYINEKINFKNKAAIKKLIIVSIICVTFMVTEIIGGIIANSLAIATDAAHLLTDLSSFIISIFSLYLVKRTSTKRMNFGWHRAEVIGAFVSVLLIWLVTAFLVYIAIQRVISRDYEINAKYMLITAGLGVAFNLIMAFILHSSGHGHSHFGNNEHSHKTKIHTENDDCNDNYSSVNSQNLPLLPKPDVRLIAVSDNDTFDNNNTEAITIESSFDTHGKNSFNKENLNVRAAFIHAIGDFIQSIGILIAAIIIYYKPDWKLADPICTFIFSILVLCTTIPILKDVLYVLMEAKPKEINFNDITKSLCTIEGVFKLHDMRIWSLSTNKYSFSVHLVKKENSNSSNILNRASQILKSKYKIYECTIQIDEYEEEMNDCQQCKDPRD